MPWVTPKTDWSAQDGVRNTDLNRIEGNIKELYDKDGVRSSQVIYVNGSSGNDETATGTPSAPFKTITAALNSVPRNMNGNTVLISVASGTYSERVEVYGFDAAIEFTGSNAGVVTIDSLRIAGCCCIISDINLTVNGSAFITSGATVFGEGYLTVNGSTLTVNYGAVLSLPRVTANSSSGYAVNVNKGSRLYAGTLGGSGNASGIICQEGSIVAYGTLGLTASGAVQVTASGGRIYSEAQYSIPEF